MTKPNKLISEFTFIKLNRLIKNKKGDYSISLRLHHESVGYFNGSYYMERHEENWVTTLTPGKKYTLEYTPVDNPKYKNNINILKLV